MSLKDTDQEDEVAQMIELCHYYTTTGYPDFKPKCYHKGFYASLKCHSAREDCYWYKPALFEFIIGIIDKPIIETK